MYQQMVRGQVCFTPTVTPTTQSKISSELLPLCRSYVLENYWGFFVAKNSITINKNALGLLLK